MASFRKRVGKNGVSWRVEIRRQGITQSATFSTKARAEAWAARIEADIADGKAGAIPDKSFADLLGRYRDEVSITKRGERWERLRIGLLLRDDKLAKIRLRELDATHVSEWRDRRLKDVAPGSVRREWTLLSHACTIAIKEWKWLKVNPFKGVRRPAPPAHREQLYSDDELERLALAFGDNTTTAIGRVGAAVGFAVETAMRAGEICALKPSSIIGSVAHLAQTKNGTPRQVPLSKEALRLLSLLPADKATLFDLTPRQLDSLFRKGRDRAMIEGKTFHDLRHTAITMLAKKLDILSLARMVGHRDLRQLMVYFNESAADIAGRL